MRPSDSIDDGELYECFECGDRAESPDRRICESCGGTLKNINRSRDL